MRWLLPCHAPASYNLFIVCSLHMSCVIQKCLKIFICVIPKEGTSQTKPHLQFVQVKYPVITSRVSGRGHRIGAVFLCVCLWNSLFITILVVWHWKKFLCPTFYSMQFKLFIVFSLQGDCFTLSVRPPPTCLYLSLINNAWLDLGVYSTGAQIFQTCQKGRQSKKTHMSHLVTFPISALLRGCPKSSM